MRHDEIFGLVLVFLITIALAVIVGTCYALMLAGQF